VFNSQEARVSVAKNSIVTEATILNAGKRNIAMDTDRNLESSIGNGINPKVSINTEIH
jgi:hypothetical protein